MNKKIAVVGMGQGGMVAAIKLAQAGAQVTVYERDLEGKVGYPWRDDITASVFKDCNLPFPDKDVYLPLKFSAAELSQEPAVLLIF